MEGLILTVDRTGNREISSHDILILDNRTRAVRCEHIAFVIHIARARIRKHHNVAERKGRGIETNVTCVTADRKPHFINGILQCQLKQRRCFIVGDIFCLCMIFIHLLEGVIGIEFDILLQQRQLCGNDGLVTNINRELLCDRERHLDLYFRLLGNARVVKILPRIVRIELTPMAVIFSILLHLSKQRFILIRSDYTRDEVIGFFTSECILDTDTVADILDSQLIADRAVVKGIISGGCVIVNEVK